MNSSALSDCYHLTVKLTMKRDQSGFTLLEAMVSIVVLSMSLFATYSWISVSVQTLHRSDEQLTQELLIGQFIQEVSLESSDRMSGALQRDNLTLVWNKVLKEKKEGRNNIGRMGFHDHALYDIEITVRKEGRDIAAYRTRVVESEKVREPDEEIFL